MRELNFKIENLKKKEFEILEIKNSEMNLKLKNFELGF